MIYTGDKAEKESSTNSLPKVAKSASHQLLRPMNHFTGQRNFESPKPSLGSKRKSRDSNSIDKLSRKSPDPFVNVQ